MWKWDTPKRNLVEQVCPLSVGEHGWPSGLDSIELVQPSEERRLVPVCLRVQLFAYLCLFGAAEAVQSAYLILGLRDLLLQHPHAALQLCGLRTPHTMAQRLLSHHHLALEVTADGEGGALCIDGGVEEVADEGLTRATPLDISDGGTELRERVGGVCLRRK